MLYELAPVGLLQTLIHGRNKSGLAVQHAIDSVVHQLHRILSIGSREWLRRVSTSGEKLISMSRGKIPGLPCQAYRPAARNVLY
jgi:hypothetical protein